MRSHVHMLAMAVATLAAAAVPAASAADGSWTQLRGGSGALGAPPQLDQIVTRGDATWHPQTGLFATGSVLTGGSLSLDLGDLGTAAAAANANVDKVAVQTALYAGGTITTGSLSKVTGQHAHDKGPAAQALTSFNSAAAWATQAVAAAAATPCLQLKPTSITCTGYDPTMNVFTLPPTYQASSSPTVVVSVPAGAQGIVHLGATGDITLGGTFTSATPGMACPALVLFAPSASSLTLSFGYPFAGGTNLNGTIIAPAATVLGSSWNIGGGGVYANAVDATYLNGGQAASYVQHCA